jgi:hypothetical protein
MVIHVRYFKCTRDVAETLIPPIGIDISWELQPDGTYIGKAYATDNLTLLRNKLTKDQIVFPVNPATGQPDRTKPPIRDLRPTVAGPALLAQLFREHPELEPIPEARAPASLKARKIRYWDDVNKVVLDEEV